MTEYTQAEIQAARALAKRHANQCKIDFDDLWAAYSDDFKCDARAAIEASGLCAPARQEAQEPVAIIEHTLGGSIQYCPLGTAYKLQMGVQFNLYTEPQPLPASQGDALSQAASDVLAERQRQISAEGWTQSHDDLEHEPGQLSSAAACYTLNASAWLKHPYASRADYANLSPINWSNWPWDEKWWKPKNERRDLVRAGALILAELERIDRADAARAAQKGKSHGK